MKTTYSVFRNHRMFEEDGYYMYKGVPVKQEYDAHNDVYWYVFRNETDLLRLNGKLMTWF